MAYEKQKFEDGQVLEAEHLNHMEDGIAAASSWDNLEGKPFGDVISEIMPETEVVGVENDGVYQCELDVSAISGEHKTLIVTFDGVAYSCDAQMLPGGILYGNSAMVGLEDTGEPFVIGVMYGAALLFMVDSKPHTVKISSEAAKPIDVRFMPCANILYSDGTYLYTSNDTIDGGLDASNRIPKSGLKNMVLSGVPIYISDPTGAVYFSALSYNFDKSYGLVAYTTNMGSGGTAMISIACTAEYTPET